MNDKKMVDRPALMAITDLLGEEMLKEGLADFIVLGVRKLEDGTADCWTRATCTTPALANMVVYLLTQLSQEQTKSALATILTHPMLASVIGEMNQPSTEQPEATHDKKAWVN